MGDIKSRLKREWEADNPILRRGELGHERGSNKIKVGDGKTRWKQLPFVPDNTGPSMEELRTTYVAAVDESGQSIPNHVGRIVFNAEGYPVNIELVAVA